MTSRKRSSYTTTNPPPVEHGMQKWLLPHTAATNQPREKEEEIRWPVVNYTSPSHPRNPQQHEAGPQQGTATRNIPDQEQTQSTPRGGMLSQFY